MTANHYLPETHSVPFSQGHERATGTICLLGPGDSFIVSFHEPTYPPRSAGERAKVGMTERAERGKRRVKRMRVRFLEEKLPIILSHILM